jgi:hypothetical protein
MTIPTEADALVLRDAAGAYYILAAGLLERARATAAQRTALVFRCRSERAVGQTTHAIREREPFQVLGVLPMPLPAPRRENPFWPGTFE